jgi:hypothetical protein
MVATSCSVLLTCAHACFPRPPRRPPQSPLHSRAAAVTTAGANAPLFVHWPGGAGGWCRGCSQICRDSSLEGPSPGADSSAREQEEEERGGGRCFCTRCRQWRRREPERLVDVGAAFRGLGGDLVLSLSASAQPDAGKKLTEHTCFVYPNQNCLASCLLHAVVDIWV